MCVDVGLSMQNQSFKGGQAKFDEAKSALSLFVQQKAAFLSAPSSSLNDSGDSQDPFLFAS